MSESSENPHPREMPPIGDFATDAWLREHLVCPRDHRPLHLSGDTLVCAAGHAYPVVEGVPVMLLEEAERVPEVIARSPEALRSVAEGAREREGMAAEVDPFVQKAVMATCGIMYRGLIGRLTRYPIPELRLPPARGETFLDVGCNWGRWCVAAARKGYAAVGVDYNLDAVLAARRVTRQLGREARYVVADARFLPFAAGSFDVAFSYSVLQHLSKADARASIAEMGRTLRPAGRALVQLPNAFGARSLYHQARRGFREPVAMEVRYWTPAELRSTFDRLVGPARLSVDGFFGLGIQPSDVELLPRRYALTVRASEALRRLSGRVGALKYAADSLYVEAAKPGA